MKSIVRYLVVIAAVAGGFWVNANRTVITDYLALRNYDPPGYVVDFADRTDMSDYGRKVFYVSKPQLEDKDQFNQDCRFPERSIVLGCYTGDRIYIFNVNEDDLDGVEEVTAAHEMLHAGYARLKTDEKDKVNDLLVQQMGKITNTRIKELIAQYKKDDPSSLVNEMHSIFGTEVGDLMPELEDYYSQYFFDRKQVVAMSDSYEQVFTDLNNKIANLEKEIAALKNQISQKEADLLALQTSIEDESARLEALKETGDIPGYNAGVPAYNSMVANYNAMVDSYKSLVALHNKKVDQRNQLATSQNDLIHSLNSKYEKI